MKHLLFFITILFAVNLCAWAQGKGIDTQTQKIRDADNKIKQDTGVGRGIDWGKGKTPDRVILSNPYRIGGKRDILVENIINMMRERKLVLDEAASKPGEGILVSQPFVFAKGSVITASELSRLAILPEGDETSWSRARYTLRVEVQPIDANSHNVSVTAKVEGRSESVLGSEWITLQSSGLTEQEFLNALVENVTGVSPNQPKPDNP
jgi:hypothetical protein